MCRKRRVRCRLWDAGTAFRQSFCVSAAVFAFADSGGGRGIGHMHDVAAVEAIPTMPASRCGVPGLGSRGMAGMASAGHHNIICLHKLYVFNYISGVIVVGHVRCCKVFIGRDRNSGHEISGHARSPVFISKKSARKQVVG